MRLNSSIQRTLKTLRIFVKVTQITFGMLIPNYLAIVGEKPKPMRYGQLDSVFLLSNVLYGIPVVDTKKCVCFQVNF